MLGLYGNKIHLITELSVAQISSLISISTLITEFPPSL